MTDAKTSPSDASGPARPRARGNNLDHVRRHNLSTVLRIVHHEGGASRAQLTRETGLNRSTIAALTRDLVDLGLVMESEPDQTSQVGRPSFMILPSARTVAIVVHPELDAVTIGLVALGGRVIRRVRYDNVRVPSAQEVVNVVAAVLAGMRDELETEFRVVGIGLVVPGLVRSSDGLVRVAPHLGWFDEPIATLLSEATGYRVTATNDASAGAVAESVFGAGRGISDLVYLNGGASGIGGGVMVGGVVLGGASGFAGEIGHTLVNSQGASCHCGAIGCLETEVARQPLLDACGLGAADAERLEEVLGQRLEAQDAHFDAQLFQLVNRQLDFLAIALRTVINVFNPRAIVFGGFLASLYRGEPERLEAAARGSALAGARDDVTFSRGVLGNDILMVGGAECAFAELLADPAGFA